MYLRAAPAGPGSEGEMPAQLRGPLGHGLGTHPRPPVGGEADPVVNHGELKILAYAEQNLAASRVSMTHDIGHRLTADAVGGHLDGRRKGGKILGRSNVDDEVVRVSNRPAHSRRAPRRPRSSRAGGRRS